MAVAARRAVAEPARATISSVTTTKLNCNKYVVVFATVFTPLSGPTGSSTEDAEDVEDDRDWKTRLFWRHRFAG